MQHSIVIYILFLAISITLGVFGQLKLKTGASSIDFSSFSSIFFNNIDLVIGIGLYGVSLIFYILSLQKIPLSIAFPSVSVSYIGVVLMAHYVLHEPINSIHMFGLAMIAIGVFSLGLATIK